MRQVVYQMREDGSTTRTIENEKVRIDDTIAREKDKDKQEKKRTAREKKKPKPRKPGKKGWG